MSAVDKQLDGLKHHLVWRYDSAQVFDGSELSPRKTGKAPPNFWPVYCGQMAGWIKMPLGTEVNLGPGDVVLDGVAAAPPKRGTAPHFTAYFCCG